MMRTSGITLPCLAVAVFSSGCLTARLWRPDTIWRRESVEVPCVIESAREVTSSTHGERAFSMELRAQEGWSRVHGVDELRYIFDAYPLLLTLRAPARDAAAIEEFLDPAERETRAARRLTIPAAFLGTWLQDRAVSLVVSAPDGFGVWRATPGWAGSLTAKSAAPEVTVIRTARPTEPARPVTTRDTLVLNYDRTVEAVYEPRWTALRVLATPVTVAFDVCFLGTLALFGGGPVASGILHRDIAIWKSEVGPPPAAPGP